MDCRDCEEFKKQKRNTITEKCATCPNMEQRMGLAFAPIKKAIYALGTEAR